MAASRAAEAPPTEAHAAAVLPRARRAQCCPTNEAVAAHPGRRPEAERDAIATELAAGRRLRRRSPSERRPTTQSAPSGGLVACRGHRSSTASCPRRCGRRSTPLPVGAVSGAGRRPSSASTSFTVVPWTFELAATRRRAASTAQQLGRDRWQRVRQRPRCSKAKIWVDPRYGTVIGAARRRQRSTPPDAPKPRDDPTADARAPTAPAGATGP